MVGSRRHPQDSRTHGAGLAALQQRGLVGCLAAHHTRPLLRASRGGARLRTRPARGRRRAGRKSTPETKAPVVTPLACPPHAVTEQLGDSLDNPPTPACIQNPGPDGSPRPLERQQARSLSGTKVTATFCLRFWQSWPRTQGKAVSRTAHGTASRPDHTGHQAGQSHILRQTLGRASLAGRPTSASSRCWGRRAAVHHSNTPSNRPSTCPPTCSPTCPRGFLLRAFRVRA